MKIYSLHIGDTKVPYGQFYGGLTGWTGMRGMWRFATDKSHYIIVPIHAYLIDHPRSRSILVDTGISWEQAHEHGRYYKGITHYVLDDDEYLLTREQELPAQAERLGYRIEDIRTVILTHFHEDHVGGLRYVPEAKVVASRAEWQALKMKAFGFIPIIYPPSIAAVKAWEPVSFTSGPFHSFGDGRNAAFHSARAGRARRQSGVDRGHLRAHLRTPAHGWRLASSDSKKGIGLRYLRTGER